MKPGLSGRLAAFGLHSPLTPLLLLVALAMGVLAIATIAREEEPQISVPMVDIQVQVPGVRADEVVELAAKPLEALVKSVSDVDHVYTFADDDQLLVTARFKVGIDPDAAVVRIHEKLRANADRIPPGVSEPLVVAHGINDVPALVITLSPRPDALGQWSDQSLHDLASRLRSELIKVEDVGLTFITGGRPLQVRVEPDPARMASHGVTLPALLDAVRQAGRSIPGGLLRNEGKAVDVLVGASLSGPAEVAALTVTSTRGEAVYVRDVATVQLAPREDQAQVWRTVRSGPGWQTTPAVSLAIAKRRGANAVIVGEAVRERIAALRGSLLPATVDVAITRDYGESANEKANDLFFHLGLATVSIVLLVGWAIGWREAAVTAVVIPTTILLTLFASKLMGYTVNRVSLFALIFSIGILVDDAIVMIENIARHWAMRDGRPAVAAAVDAVAEVGNPTVVATLTVVAALLPMLFVSGLMGPYMAPIPVNASAAMVFSFFVAVVLVPWLMVRFARQALQDGAAHHGEDGGGKLGALYRRVASRVIATRASAWRFLLVVGVATVLAGSLFATRTVTVKLLPFDNKSELQVILDLPAGTSLEGTGRTLAEAARLAAALPEVLSIDAYAGTASPFNFNGLVRHYYLRSRPWQGDLALVLTPKGERSRNSHAIALDLRQRLAALRLPAGSALRVVEAPPGPPVMATLLAEVYGPDASTRRAVATQLKAIFQSVPFIVDVDDSFGGAAPRLHLVPDRDRLEHLRVSQREVLDSAAAALQGQTVALVQRGGGRDPLPVTVQLPQSARSWTAGLASLPVATAANRLVTLGEVVTASPQAGSTHRYRRDGRDADMVMGELAGAYEAPIYGLAAVDEAIAKADWQGLSRPQVRLHGQPDDESVPTVLWDGEWEITWVTFRDMGAAFGVALLGIYILVVIQFGSFRLPLVILTPIPLTLVGIVFGHILFKAPFTATSMIGFIALAGIIVRNSILLVDFIRHAQADGRSLREVLLEAGAVRFKPILLTALAAMIGAAVILTDPIFQGLAISLLFGLASSTLLTVLVIPAIYVVLRDDGRLVAAAGSPST